MNLLDINVWLALALSGHAHHGACRAWLESVSEPATALFCRVTQSGFLRLLTNPSVLAPYGNPALTNREAWAAYEALQADERVDLRVSEPPGLSARWRELAVRDSASPKLWMDAYLAAFAIATGCRLVTTDTAFQQFGELDLVLLGAPADP